MKIDWAEVYRTTFEDLVRFLHRKVWDADRASDLAQEAFVRALDREPDNPRAWLFTVASNLARDDARSAMRRRRHLRLIKSEAAAKAAPDPAEELEQRQRAAQVKRALSQLSERDREILLLWDGGLAYDEIARETGLSPRAIGTTLARARRRLVEAYDALEGENVARG
ncbi:MAG: sigma-70 family RNA polymerase sigma factor [Gemmatimonadales bacterium]